LFVALFITAPVAALDSCPDASLDLIVRDSYLPGVPVLVRVELRRDEESRCVDTWDATAMLSVDGDGATVTPDSIPLRNGIGSALVEISGLDDVTLTATVGDEELVTSRELEVVDPDEIETISGTLGGIEVEWSGAIYLDAELRIPEGTTLTIAPGTLILIEGVEDGAGGTDIEVDGVIESLGTRERPITFTARDPNRPWAEFDIDGPFGSFFRYTHITRGGHSPAAGHTDTGPVLRVEQSSVVFESCAITDISGKTMMGAESEVEFIDTIVARSAMGPEVVNTGFSAVESYFGEMYGDDDNDCLYIQDPPAGETVTITDCIVATCDDDGIDMRNALASVKDTIVRDIADKGVSAYYGDLNVQASVFVDNGIGISAKGSDDAGARVSVDHVTIVRCDIGIEANDKDDVPLAEIYYEISNSIIRHTNGAESHTVRTDYDPSFITIDYSALTDPWTGDGNLVDDPLFVDLAGRDLHLAAGSPCIDAGDPEFEADPDGSRTDMGAFPFVAAEDELQILRGEVNGDGNKDITDPITILRVLFQSGAFPCTKAADCNDSGRVDISDAVFFLEFEFLGGPPLPPPADECGVDPTEDDLPCEETACE